MDNIINTLIDNGFTADTLQLLLFLPILATLVNVSRYVVGLKTYGIYAPITLSYAYLFTGIRFGLLITTGVIIATFTTFYLLRKIRMHYISRISIAYILITFLVIGVVMANEISPVQLTTDNHNLNTVPPLGIVLIAGLADFFIKKFNTKSLNSTILSLVETLTIAMIGWSLMRLTELGNFLFENLWVFPLLLILNFYIGQYRGLQLKEYFRFRKVFNAIR